MATVKASISSETRRATEVAIPEALYNWAMVFLAPGTISKPNETQQVKWRLGVKITTSLDAEPGNARPAMESALPTITVGPVLHIAQPVAILYWPIPAGTTGTLTKVAFYFESDAPRATADVTIIASLITPPVQSCGLFAIPYPHESTTHVLALEE